MVVQPRALLALLVADAGLLVFRAVAVVDAYLLATRDGRRRPATGGWRRGAVVGLVVVLGLTAAPHAAAAYYDLQAYDLLTSVFAGEDPLWHGRPGERHENGNGLVTAIPGRVTVLLIGGDAGPGRRGLRTDTMIVASYEVATGKLSLFGLPRNMIQVPLPDGPAADYFGECRCFPRLLNELYAFAEDERPDLFPHSRRPGIAAVAGAAEELLGLPIDHYALVDLLGFVDVVDAVGGVTVNNLKSLDIEIDRLGREGSHPAIEVAPGRRHLNGFQALAYSHRGHRHPGQPAAQPDRGGRRPSGQGGDRGVHAPDLQHRLVIRLPDPGRGQDPAHRAPADPADTHHPHDQGPARVRRARQRPDHHPGPGHQRQRRR
jgi:hypothetical protein